MTSSGFGEQFLEDYFAECDEHLATIRRALLALEAHPGVLPADDVQLAALRRSLHTVKGLSGMVGLGTAERVAHVMEDALRGVGASTPAAEHPMLLEALFAAARELELCIAARRRGEASCHVDDFLAEFERATAGATAGTTATGATQADHESRQRGDAGAEPASTDQVIYRFEFTPSAELARRGIGVATIRSRLLALGDMLDARPHVTGGHAVVFAFRVAVPPRRMPDEGWRADGLTWIEEAAARDTAPPTPRTPASSRDAPGSGRRSDTMAFATAGANVVRVELSRVDDLMRLVSELVVSRARFTEALSALAPDPAGDTAAWQTLHETNTLMERQLRALRERITRVRLVAVGEVFERVRFAAREVARETGKEMSLELQGEDTEIDKLIVDRMLEPLLHLVRNAVSHGIEPPDVRVAHGKPRRGRLSLRASASGDRICIEVDDDGAGVDIERVTARARAHGLLGPAESLAPERLLDVLGTPGFSTRDEADLASGRGIGVGVVAGAVRELGGRLDLQTAAGQGTRFLIELPLTLMIVDALLVDVGGQRMAVPQPSLREILQVDTAALTPVEHNEVLAYRGGVLPVIRLARLFTMPEVSAAARYLLVVGSDTQLAGLLVDRLGGLREIVVHPVPDPLVAVPGVAGATELGDGRVSLILDTSALVRMTRERADHLAPGRAPVVAAIGEARA